MTNENDWEKELDAVLEQYVAGCEGLIDYDVALDTLHSFIRTVRDQAVAEERKRLLDGLPLPKKEGSPMFTDGEVRGWNHFREQVRSLINGKE